MTRTIKEWYLGEEDKEEIKRFSKGISVIFKVKGYNPKAYMFEDYFNLEEFDFIPCVREVLDNDNADDDDLQDVEDYLDSVYDPSVKVGLQDLIKNEEKFDETVKEKLIKEKLKETLFEKQKDFGDFVDFIFSCSDDVKQKFVNWLY